MADSGKRPAEHALDPAPPAPVPLGALSPLPEVLLAHLCSFLSGRDLARLGGACAALHESPVSLWPRLKVGLRKGLGKEDEEGGQRRVEALRMLARRAASGLKELWLEEANLPEAFYAALGAGGQPLRQLTSLHATLQAFRSERRAMPSAVSVGGMQQALADMLAVGQLPMLRELHLLGWGVKSVLPVWRAVGQGACPRLERIKIDDCSSQQLAELVEAMRARPEGCEELRAVCLTLDAEDEEQAICEALQALLSRLSPRSLEELCLTAWPFESLQAAIRPLLTSSWSALKTLKLRLWATPSVDGLLHALARGAMPSLTSLHVSGGTCSDEAWRALGEAMGPEGTCLRRLKTLKLHDVISSPRQLAVLCRAMGTGHGCPELEVMGISRTEGYEEAWGAALAPAFRPPHGLPRLKELHISFMELTDLDQLVEALQHRPHASQPVETIGLWGCQLESIAALGQAMAEGRSLAFLRELKIDSVGVAEEWPEQWPMQLVEALAGGAGQQLEKLQCSTDGQSVEVANRLLQGLAIDRGCPRLQSLWLEKDPDGVVEEGQLDACSLGTILAGRAACSATLRSLRLNGVGILSNEGVRRLAACLREPQAIQLECLELCAGEPDACEAVMELLSALGGRAGARLGNLFMRLSTCEEGEVMRVAEHVMGIIRAGGLPTVQHDGWPDGIKVVAAKSISMGLDAIMEALWKRAQEQWLASW